MACLIQIRRDSTTNWTSVNPVLASGELGIDETENDFKIGDGITAWNSLPFLLGPATYTDETAQDAVGGILTDTASIDFTYNDGTPSITADVLPAGVDHDSLQNYDADHHVDHTTVSITGADGLSGGGTIDSSRTITLPNTGTADTYGSASQVPVFTTDTKGRITGVVDTDILIDIEDVTDLQVTLDGKHFRHGIEDRTKIDISYNPTTRILTLTPNDVSYNVWINGTKTTISSVKTTTAHADVTNLYFVTMDANGDLSVSAIPWDVLDVTYTPISSLYYNTDITDAIVLNELHGADRNLATHRYLHFVVGTSKKLDTDFAISGYTLDQGDSAGVTYALSAGTVIDEDIMYDIGALSDGGPYTLFRRTGAANWIWVEGESVPYFYETNVQYNQNDGGSYILSDVGNNNFVNYFVVATSAISSNNNILIVPSQLEHSSESDAVKESFEDIDVSNIPIQEVAGLWRITYKVLASSTAPGNAIMVSISALSNFGTSAAGIGGGGTTVHNALSGREALDAHPWTSITEFAEGAQDSVAAMLVDTDTIDFTYTDITPELKFDVISQMSITSDASGIKLSGDSASPGNEYHYGTNGSGTKGWYANDISIGTIGGYDHPVYVDTTKSSKTLTVATHTFMWAELVLTDENWLQIGVANSSNSAYHMPYNGTVVGAVYQCEDDSSQTKDLNLYINSTPTTLFTTDGSGLNQYEIDNSLNLDFSAGDRLRMRAGTNGNDIQDTVVTLFVKWRV